MIDQRIQYTERMVGNGSPSFADTLNRQISVEHNIDGTHGAISVSGNIKYSSGNTIASAATLTIPSAGSIFAVSGAVTISGIATVGIGTQVTLKFLSTPTLIHSASLILPNAANINTVVDDVCTFYEYGVGQWMLINKSNSGPTTPPDGSITPIKLIPYTSGSTVLIAHSADYNTTSNGYIKAKEIYLPQGGSYTVSFQIIAPTSTGYGRIFKNGVAYGVEHSILTSTATFTENIGGFVPGDFLQLYVHTTYTANITVNNLSLSVANSTLLTPAITL